ncbi:MAG: bifunctional diaminohydroxyphosphoribosylaminopyrimidine deaminase/5-amino-6-(5-phosphoribosylamino)uracil reductase RibD [Phycisphaerales bacterium]|jgi:diaminohydroxyphosphoribosylaminopyrimidine deaminase/5-amino-6-(5-phosphoribosylamino)uracil reductase
MITSDEKCMQAALKLAVRGIGSVEPNPAVGCIIVKSGQVIGKGWHKKFGGPHAEINALEDCKSIGANPKDATMYVTLEPCCHEGKTPACTEAIIEAGVGKVVVAMLDPSENVNGKGIVQLQQAGIKTQIGICREQAKLLNAPFIKHATTGKTWVILKWAQSIDGKLAWAQQDNEHRWISCAKSRDDVQKLRGRVQAILVGIGTVLADDPLLTVRPSKGKTLTRIVLDSQLRIPLDCQLLKTAKKQPVLIIAYETAGETNAQKLEQVEASGAEVLTFPDLHGKSNLHFVMEQLSKRGCQQLLIEGGPSVISSFLREKLADEICVYVAPKILAGKGAKSIKSSLIGFSNSFELNNVTITSLEDDARITGLTHEGLSTIEEN